MELTNGIYCKIKIQLNKNLVTHFLWFMFCSPLSSVRLSRPSRKPHAFLSKFLAERGLVNGLPAILCDHNMECSGQWRVQSLFWLMALTTSNKTDRTCITVKWFLRHRRRILRPSIKVSFWLYRARVTAFLLSSWSRLMETCMGRDNQIRLVETNWREVDNCSRFWETVNKKRRKEGEKKGYRSIKVLSLL